MKKLRGFFTNPFRTSRLSLAALIAFTTDLIHRMIAMNPDGELDERIAGVSAALARLNGEMVDDGVQLGLRKGAVFEKREFRAELATELRPIFGAVWAAFNDPSEEKEELFPKGRSFLLKCRDDTLGGALTSLVIGVTKYQAELGAETLERAVSLRDRWQSIYESSEAATGEKAATEIEQRSARANLERELFLTVSRLMWLYPDDPDRFELYMQQYLLNPMGGKAVSRNREQPRFVDSSPDDPEFEGVSGNAEWEEDD